MILVMKRWILGLLIGLLSVTPVAAQDTVSKYLIPNSPQSHSYTVNLKEDGTSRVWLRIDAVVFPREGGEYKIRLPNLENEEVMAWYRESGCVKYRGNVCDWDYINVWKDVVVKKGAGGEWIVTVPPRQVDERSINAGGAIGISYLTTDLTEKMWWGRQVKVTTATTMDFVNYVNIGVFLPDGVYGRNKQKGPQGWGVMLSEIGSMGVRELAPEGAPKILASTMLDMAGNGHINRSRTGVMPGESYSFGFMSSTSIWKLYAQEIGVSLGWVLGIAVVMSLLLFLLIRRKSLGWYLAVTVLFLLLFAMLAGLWFTFQFNFGMTGGIEALKGGSETLIEAVPAGEMATEVMPVSEPGLEPEKLPVEMVRE